MYYFVGTNTLCDGRKALPVGPIKLKRKCLNAVFESKNIFKTKEDAEKMAAKINELFQARDIR